MRVFKPFFTPIVRVTLWGLLCVSAVPDLSRAEDLPPFTIRHEGSSLLRVENAPLLKAKGWKRAFWVVFDEIKDGSPLGLLGQRIDNGSWQLQEVPLTQSDPKIDDAEALARKDGFIYLVGSHFGKKKGKLEAARQFVARFRESKVHGTSPEVDLEIRRDDFELHRLLNEALVKWNVDLIARGTGEEKEYIKKTQESDEPGKGNVQKNDRALNIEGATFLDSGQLALGLRYPVTKQGEPLVVVLDHADAFFEKNKFPKVVAVWILHGAGTPAQLRGIRELNSGNGEIQAILGSIERFSTESPILKDHPDADKVTSEHRAFTAPALKAKTVDARLVRSLAPAGTVEGVSVDDSGDWYLFDEADRVQVRHEAHP